MGIFEYIIFCIFAILLGVLIKKFLFPQQLKNVENRHVVVTGGSSGIGKSLAVVAARHGAHVTIIARNTQKLEEARDEIARACKYPDKQKIEYLSLDISQNYDEVKTALLDLESRMGSIYMLVNCAGIAIFGKIEDTTITSLKQMIDLNFMGTYYCIKAVISKMKLANDGIVVLASSQAALIGLFGMSAYCSSKFALRGLAESLAMEVFPYNVSVTLCLPPDTDTPGFHEENKSKPLETKLISESSGLWSPDDVASKLFKDALASKFFSTIGFEGFLMTNLCAGMSPFGSWCEVLVQSMLMGLSRIISAFYMISFRNIILNCIKSKNMNKKSF